MFKYFLLPIVALTILASAIMLPASAIMRSFADWRESANGATVAKEQRVTVEAQENGLTKRTEIEWDARVEIAEIDGDVDVKVAKINADVEKKTSFAYSFYLLVFSGIWFGVCLVVGNLIKRNRSLLSALAEAGKERYL